MRAKGFPVSISPYPSPHGTAKKLVVLSVSPKSAAVMLAGLLAAFLIPSGCARGKCQQTSPDLEKYTQDTVRQASAAPADLWFIDWHSWEWPAGGTGLHLEDLALNYVRLFTSQSRETRK